MTTSLGDLLAQREALERQIREAQREQQHAALTEIRRLMEEHGLSVNDLGASKAGAKSRSSHGGKIAPKYRDPQTGQTWSGRGLKPKWLTAAIEGGKTLEDFAL